jgi:hypothetical protein
MTEFIEVELTPEQIAEREAWAAGAYDREYAQVEQQRQNAYQQYSDPIMAQYLRDEATKEEWLAAVQKVKDDHPYPEKVE